MQGLCCRLPTFLSGRHFLGLAISGLITGDGAADAVLLTIQAALLGLGQVAVVLRHVPLFAVLQVGFPGLKTRSLPGIQGAVPHAIGNTPLLVTFAGVDFIHARMTGIDYTRAGALLRSGGPY